MMHFLNKKHGSEAIETKIKLYYGKGGEGKVMFFCKYLILTCLNQGFWGKGLLIVCLQKILRLSFF